MGINLSYQQDIVKLYAPKCANVKEYLRLELLNQVGQFADSIKTQYLYNNWDGYVVIEDAHVDAMLGFVCRYSALVLQYEQKSIYPILDSLSEEPSPIKRHILIYTKNMIKGVWKVYQGDEEDGISKVLCAVRDISQHYLSSTIGYILDKDLAALKAEK